MKFFNVDFKELFRSPAGIQEHFMALLMDKLKTKRVAQPKYTYEDLGPVRNRGVDTTLDLLKHGRAPRSEATNWKAPHHYRATPIERKKYDGAAIRKMNVEKGVGRRRFINQPV